MYLYQLNPPSNLHIHKCGKFSRMDVLVIVRGSIFADAHDRAITSMYKQAYFVGLTFAVHDNRDNYKNWTPRKFPTIQYYYA